MSDGFVIVTGKRGSKWNRTPKLRPNMKMQQTLEDIDEVAHFFFFVCNSFKTHYTRIQRRLR